MAQGPIGEFLVGMELVGGVGVGVELREASSLSPLGAVWRLMRWLESVE